MLGLAAKQVARQAALQPRLALPAGRTVSLEEGRRLAKLVNDEEERLTASATQSVAGAASDSPVVLEDGVSRRILVLRQRQNHSANVKAAVAHAQRQQQKRNAISQEDGATVQEIAKKLLRKQPSAQHGSAMKERKQRASNPAGRRKGKGRK